MGMINSISGAPSRASSSRGTMRSMERPRSDLLGDHSRRKATIEDDGRRWSPRVTLLLAGGVSLAVWGAIIAAAVR